MGRVKQAVILAAGEGQRLRPLTRWRPKVVLPIANKPILQYVVESLADEGVRNIIMVVGYRKEHVLNYFGNGAQFGVEIEYVVQERQLGTAHALKQVKGKVQDRFLVLSGDTIIEPNTIAHLVDALQESLMVKAQQDVSKYGTVEVKDGIAQRITEKPYEAQGNLVNLGLYAFTPGIFKFTEDSLELTEALQKLIDDGQILQVYETKDTWLDVVYPWDILRLNEFILGRISPMTGGVIEPYVNLKGAISVGRGSIIRSNCYITGPVTIGRNCDIGPNVYIAPSTSIGDDVIIAAFTQIKNSILGDRVRIGSHSIIENTFIDKGSVMKEQFVACTKETEVKIDGEHHQVDMGAVIGRGCIIENSVMLLPGIVVGNYTNIRSGNVVRENLPDESLVV